MFHNFVFKAQVVPEYNTHILLLSYLTQNIVSK